MNLITCLLKRNDCYRAGQRMTPKGVMVHSTGAPNPMLRRYVQPLPGDQGYDQLMEWLGRNPNGNSWNRSGVGACVHAFIGKLADGSIATAQTLPWGWRGWHAGNGTTRPSANNTHISFEICEDGLEDRDYFEAVYREAVELTAMLCQMYDLDPTEPGVICHSEGHALGMASGHADVMHWFPRFGKTMDDFRADVAEDMHNEHTPNEVPEEDIDVKPDLPITSEQFSALMGEYLSGLSLQPGSDWSAEDRAKSIEIGLIKGVGDLNDDGEMDFAWRSWATREETTAMLLRLVPIITPEVAEAVATALQPTIEEMVQKLMEGKA